MTTTDTAVVQVEAGPGVSAADVDYAQDKLAAALRLATEPVLFARLRLSLVANPSVEQPALVEAGVDHNGRLLRVQSAAPTMHEAVDRMQARLRSRLERVARHWEAVRGSRPVEAVHEWRHSQAPAGRPAYLPRPVADRRLVRRKTFSLTRLTVDLAARELDLLDYDFHLYVDHETGEPAVLSRTGDGYRLQRLRAHRGDTPTTSLPRLHVVSHAAPRLTLDEALDRLDAGDEAFVFYRDVDDGYGHVLYRRYDGNYGLISPAT